MVPGFQYQLEALISGMRVIGIMEEWSQFDVDIVC